MLFNRQYRAVPCIAVACTICVVADVQHMSHVCSAATRIFPWALLPASLSIMCVVRRMVNLSHNAPPMMARKPNKPKNPNANMITNNPPPGSSCSSIAFSYACTMRAPV